ncbi:CocE/NonD family hydrolase [Frankia sp. AgB1.9]|uniref:CocE/NonD family hydrolase n=1 Tax=unclassified Frankia TaxID=2632575 RepID=UPI001934887F|nr:MULTISPECIES: CocE/NonD family hydrolase [unclassified Frankia]MBL7488484.1 CocE/NonD family hydrolase [Frankia sp. AgW1.1]MBL7547267.1 CocE/NonD family hydrolase [Frankia sp. AgB1.9]MBL7620828.1 CocE/NonD family hydrolase [Frankia sp. AgB1.8]
MIAEEELIVDKGVMVPMRDGVRLYTEIYRPPGDGPFPVLVSRTAYWLEGGVTQGLTEFAKLIARQGYVAIFQQSRGRFASEGEFHPGLCDIDDGYDVVEWAAAQPWSTGKVGMFGGSYQGITQWAAAIARPPHLVCIAPLTSTWNSFGNEIWYAAPGVLSLGSAFAWAWGAVLGEAERRGVPAPDGAIHHGEEGNEPGDVAEAIAKRAVSMMEMYAYRPLRDIPQLELVSWWKDWCDHGDPDDPYWLAINASEHAVDLDLPVFHASGWYDLFLNGTIEAFQTLHRSGANQRVRDGQELVVGPWNHGGMCPPRPDAPANSGPHGLWDLSEGSACMEFFRRHLKGEQVPDVAPVRLFVMGENTWRDEQEWPLARTQWTPYYLHSAGAANTAGGDGVLSTLRPEDQPADVFVYDPQNPVVSQGRLECYAPDHGAETARNEGRDDVLVYTTPPLEQDVEVTGPVTLEIWASSSVADTDFTAKLVDVFPDGSAMPLAEGVVRTGVAFTQPPAPETPRRYRLDLWATSNVFKTGHRIRLDVSSSAFPEYELNPNTGQRITEDASGKTVPATQQVHHDGRHPSRLILPVIPRPAR